MLFLISIENHIIFQAKTETPGWNSVSAYCVIDMVLGIGAHWWTKHNSCPHAACILAGVGARYICKQFSDSEMQKNKSRGG
jgi:hypothetical protein